MKCLLLLSILVVAFNSNAVNGCRCLPLSMIPPVQDCPGYFLSILTVTNVRLSNRSAVHDYKLHYDLTPKLKNHGDMTKYQSIVSDREGATCGMRLQAGQTYLIMGRLPEFADNPTISLCGTLVETLEKVPTKEDAERMMNEKFQERCVEKKIINQ